MFDTMADVRAANKAIGHHYFERSTMRFFKSRIESELYGGRFFITSEQFDDKRGNIAPRKYTIRRVHGDGVITTASEYGFQAFGNIEDVRSAARELARQED